MKKSLILLSSILLLAGATDLKAGTLWLLNLTNKPQSFQYLQEVFAPEFLFFKKYDHTYFGKKWVYKYFSNIPAHSKSNGHALGLREVYFENNRRGHSDWTIVVKCKERRFIINGKYVYGKEPCYPETILIPESIYKSQKVKDLIKESLGKGDPKNLIKNW